MEKKKLLMIIGNYVEDYEVMVPFQMPGLCGPPCEGLKVNWTIWRSKSPHFASRQMTQIYMCSRSASQEITVATVIRLTPRQHVDDARLAGQWDRMRDTHVKPMKQTRLTVFF
jgi:hypothetical protein